MARTLKCSKHQLMQLLNVTDQVPSGKLASDIGKHLAFRKAIKKHLKEFIDMKADAVEKAREEQKRILELIKPIDNELKTADEKAKPELEQKKQALEAELQAFVNKINTDIDAYAEDLKVKKVEVVFDNEDYNWEKNVIKENATAIFKLANDKFNADQAEVIFDILDSAD